MKTKIFLIIIFMTFFISSIFKQDYNKFPYTLKKADSNIRFNTIPKKINMQRNFKISKNSIGNIIPVYPENMIWDQEIIAIPGRNHNQILNQVWAYGHFIDQFQNPSSLFQDLMGTLFLPTNGDSVTLLAIDSRDNTIYYTDENNIFSGIGHYGDYGSDQHHFIYPQSFILGREA